MGDLAPFVPLLQTLLWVGLVVAAVAYFRPEIALLRRVLADRAARGGAFELGPLKVGELRDELRTVRRELDATKARVEELFLLTMSPAMYENLRKLAGGSFGPYTRNKGLERELYPLRDIGYVAVESITALPPDGPDLSAHVAVTPSGRLFVELREALLGGKGVPGP